MSSWTSFGGALVPRRAAQLFVGPRWALLDRILRGNLQKLICLLRSIRCVFLIRCSINFLFDEQVSEVFVGETVRCWIYLIGIKHISYLLLNVDDDVLLISVFQICNKLALLGEDCLVAFEDGGLTPLLNQCNQIRFSRVHFYIFSPILRSREARMRLVVFLWQFWRIFFFLVARFGTLTPSLLYSFFQVCFGGLLDHGLQWRPHLFFKTLDLLQNNILVLFPLLLGQKLVLRSLSDLWILLNLCELFDEKLANLIISILFEIFVLMLLGKCLFDEVGKRCYVQIHWIRLRLWRLFRRWLLLLTRWKESTYFEHRRFWSKHICVHVEHWRLQVVPLLIFLIQIACKHFYDLYFLERILHLLHCLLLFLHLSLLDLLFQFFNFAIRDLELFDSPTHLFQIIHKEAIHGVLSLPFQQLLVCQGCLANSKIATQLAIVFLRELDFKVWAYQWLEIDWLRLLGLVFLVKQKWW